MQIEIERLKPHPLNDYYFDELPPAEFEDLKRSIETSGCIERPLILYDRDAYYYDGDLIILSGTQRVRAMRELGYKFVSVEFAAIIDRKNEDEVLKQLIECNLCRRGGAGKNLNDLKLGRCYTKLSEIYGIRIGSAGKRSKTEKDLERQNVSPKTQAELAEHLGTSPKQMQRCMSLSKLIPGLQNAYNDKRLNKTLAAEVAKWEPEEQEKLLNYCKDEKIITRAEINYINDIEAYIDSEQKDNSFRNEIFFSGIQERNSQDETYWMWETCDRAINSICSNMDRPSNRNNMDFLFDAHEIIKDYKNKLERILTKMETELMVSPQDK